MNSSFVVLDEVIEETAEVVVVAKFSEINFFMIGPFEYVFWMALQAADDSQHAHDVRSLLLRIKFKDGLGGQF